MFAKWIDPVVKDYLYHDSPLRKPNGKMIFWAIIAVVGIFDLIGLYRVVTKHSPLLVLALFLFGIVGSIIGYLIIRFLDRERRVVPFHFLAVLSVLLGTSGAVIYFNEIFEPPVRYVFVGFNEEFFKILPVVMFAIYVPNLIRTRKDGMVYGALAGIGFNIIEIALYITNALDDGMLLQDAAVFNLTRLGIFGFGGHIIWSAFVGLGLGITIESTKTGWGKWKYLIIYYLIAAISHSIGDLYGSTASQVLLVIIQQVLFGIDVATMPQTPYELGPLNTAARLRPYVWNLFFIIIIIVQIRRSFATENTIQVEELSSEEPVVMREEELARLKAEKLVTKRKYNEYPKDISNKLVYYQNLLAMAKHTAKQTGRAADEYEPVIAFRRAIRSLRSTV